MRRWSLRIFTAIVVVSNAVPLTAQTGVGTAFTYQGRLTDNGAPANGAATMCSSHCSMRPRAARKSGRRSRKPACGLGGVFTALLDFGAGIFNGNARWLQIGVRPGGTSGAFAVIAPRQQLTPSPNALHSTEAGNSQSLAGLPPHLYAKTGDPVAASTLTGKIY